MIEYHPIKAADIPQIKELYATYLNSGDFITEQISKAWEDGTYMGCAAKENDRLIGFLTARPGICFTYPHPELEAELADYVSDRRVAMCDAILVLPEYRRDGLAHVMAKKVREQLIQMGYDIFLEEIWIYPDGRSPAKKILESMGTLIWQRRCDGFYREMEQYGMRCPICGDRCECGAWVNLLAL